jgi:hypothetical protein
MGVTIHRRTQAAAVGFAAFLLLATPSAARHGRTGGGGPCTHGASSIGPVVFRNGKIVGPEPVPHTEACLRSAPGTP